MWGKSNEREVEVTPAPRPAPPAAQPVAPAPPPPPSSPVNCFGKTMKLKGEIRSKDEFYFDGELEGRIEVDQRLTIGPNGKVKAAIKAGDLVVRGSVEGNVEARDRIVISNGASIVGDVKTSGIVIEDGAYFKGGIDILRPQNGKAATAK
jgi:cytoskeletal protein CcmA (bactofilin family)